MQQPEHPLSLFTHCPKCGGKRFEIHNEKSKECADCHFVYYYNSSASVVAFITGKDGGLLVCRRAKEPAKGTLDLPGGFVDLNETGEEAVIREIKEETGLEISTVRYLFSLPNIYPYSGFTVHTLDLFFECEVKNSDRLQANDDVAEVFFLPRKEIDPEKFGLTSVKKGLKSWLDMHKNDF
ncbi:MAG: NUDIX domain-containing protein [Candidatus Azobacteroides sp.]|nr:NUDIX domain-containing protein [Candidatus Azobacteroides sp.]